MNGILLDPKLLASNPVIAWEIEDAVNCDGIAGKWGVEGKLLVAKLEKLTPIQNIALGDAINLRASAIRRGEACAPRFPLGRLQTPG